ncbi:APC family permease [Mesomycoplasma neurolyticum]|uniref:Serine/threonine exchanger SteT n=1 Tax=Mesomycoplasma neurolyticum TaxID=2120 RepID=A0A449A494_9BACT|nr:amino acid permease [Mesomycoplasma neurolyticum]VEU59059.1 Serine/threonine exchanger SteT [Mesomycoplasma neurolyticum]
MLKQTKKFGFFIALTMLIGSVVGIGIFFKNNSVSKATNHDGWTWLMAWIVGGIISFAAALNFSEIGTSKIPKLNGLSSWIYRVKGAKVGYAINVTFIIFYYGILFSALGIFLAEAILFFLGSLGAINLSNVPFWVAALLGFIMGAFIVVTNIFSTKSSGLIQSTTVILKFLPLIASVFIGIIFFKSNNLNSELNSESFNAFINKKSFFSFKGLIVALPAILFAYDSFLIVGSISSKLKKPKRDQFLVILVGMSIVITLYSLIAISSILHNQGVIHKLIETSLPKTAANFILPIVSFFIMVSIFGTYNGVTLAFLTELETAAKVETIFGIKFLKNKFGITKTKFIYVFALYLIVFVISILPSIILNNDRLIDGVTNYPTIFFFMVYAFNVVVYTIKRKKITETTKLNNIIFYTAALIFVIGISIIEVTYFVLLISDVFNENFETTWGLFIDGDASTIPSYVGLLFYFLMLIFAISIPFLNFYLEKLIFKRNIIKELEQKIQLSK